jgi:hypothetical protein
MPASLVPPIDEQDLVCFPAEEADDLLVAVDQCTDPPDCDYTLTFRLLLRAAGIRRRASGATR